MLIGIHGLAGAGKSLVASMIPGAHSMQFADPLYEMISVLTGIPVDVLKIRSVKETVIPWIGKSPRQLLQTLGTEWGRGTVKDSLWLSHFDRRLDKVQQSGHDGHVAVCDLRFDNEAEYIEGTGGVVWHVHRPGLKRGLHSSEAGIALRVRHRLIVNDGTIEELREQVECLL